MERNYINDKSLGIDIIEYIKSHYSEKLPCLSQIQKEINDMQTRFPLESIPNMTIEEYVTVGNPFCFINMIEQKTASVASGFLAYNRNRLFYQKAGDEQRYVVSAIANEKRFKGLEVTEIFGKYMQEFYDFITTFDPETYDAKKYMFGANVIKSKLIMLYRPELGIAGFTSKDHAKRMAEYLQIPVSITDDDSLGINIKIKNFLIAQDATISQYNMFVVGRLIWDFYSEYVDEKTGIAYLEADRKDDFLLLENLDNEKTPDADKLAKKKALPPVKDKGILKYYRDPAIAKEALRLAKHCCECNPNHETFIKKSTKKKYTEPHHLIPMSAQKDFEYSLDVLPNIISLCSTCHNKLHYGLDVQDTIIQLYNARKEQLEEFGIGISLEKLLSYYR